MQDMILLIEPLIPALRRYARSLLRDASAADDLVQDCLERAISRWHQRRQDGNVRAWVFSILHNLAINRQKQRSRRGQHLSLDEVTGEHFAYPATQESTILYQELLRALDELPYEQRSVLLLVSVEDLSYADAAQVLSIPIGTVMSRLSRARDRLLHRMEPQAAAGSRYRHLRRIK
jgi:RNA polymerase sigma-70 factor (ECF subfamily)